tara:strand:+ start:71 stop:238 length:168 start_codon:yes stop_codon:yes gene_type:complete
MWRKELFLGRGVLEEASTIVYAAATTAAVTADAAIAATAYCYCCWPFCHCSRKGP